MNIATSFTDFETTVQANFASMMEEIKADPIKQAQFDLEIGMVQAGARRFWETQTKRRGKTGDKEATTMAGNRMAKGAIDNLAHAFHEFMYPKRAGRPGRLHDAVKVLRRLDYETVANITITTALDVAATSVPAIDLAKRIGKALADAIRLADAQAKAPALMASIRRDFKTGNRAFHAKVFQAVITRSGLEDTLPPSLTHEERIKAGTSCVHILVESSGLFKLFDKAKGEIKTLPNGRRLAVSDRHVSLTEQAFEWITKHDNRQQFLMPIYMPCIQRPRRWNSFRSGGYHYALRNAVPLIRTGPDYGGHPLNCDRESAPAVFKMLDAVQETAWQVNPGVFAVFQDAFNRERTLGKLPMEGPVPLIPPLVGIPKDYSQRTPEMQSRLQAWKRKRRLQYEQNAERIRDRKKVSTALTVAERFSDGTPFYFVHFMDFRGRVYPVAAYLTPHGEDWQKALLRFADGVPLGEQGAVWLAVHGANNMGEDPETAAKLDKSPFQKRVDWVTEHTAKIIHAAEDPLHDTWWQQADNPWQFLAFCMEWRDYIRSGQDEKFVSHLPVSFDGSCNGLQHFSAMLRDEVGGASVNLVPQEVCADIYSDVKEDAVGLLLEIEADAANPEKAGLATDWLYSAQLDRGLVKRPVMTMPYGSRQFGMTDQISEELDSRGFTFDPEAGNLPHCRIMSEVVWQAICERVVKAKEMMDWLQKIAGLYAKANKGMHWRTPSGFVVNQDVRKIPVVRVDIVVSGKRIQHSVKDRSKTGEIDRIGMRNSIAPNFVHSFDAAAQALTFAALHEKGVRHFMSVHDSFGTHAGNGWPLYEQIRETFVGMYSGWDVIAEFTADALPPVQSVLDEKPKKGQRRAKWPEPPLPGTLDIEGVMTSDFFFA